MKPLITILLLAGLAAAAATEDPLPPQAQADVQTLKDAGIQPDDAGLRKYLRSLSPSPEVRKEIAGLIAQLGSEDFVRREKASRRLTELVGLAGADLEKASRDEDREVARRAKAILADDAGADRRAEVLLAALREVTRRKTPGVVPSLLETLPRLRRFDLRQAAGRALAATARPEDAEALRRALESQDESVCLAAAVILLDHGDRRALTALGRLLDCEDLATRNRAGRVLRAVTGKDLGFIAYADLERRAQAAARWRRWIDEEGTAARLSLPAPAQTPLGKVVLACHGPREGVVELDEAGRKVGERIYKGIECCEGLPDGHLLLGGASRRVDGDLGRVDEYDAEGRSVWGLSVRGIVTAVRRLPSGHTLVAFSHKSGLTLREYRPDKSVRWEASLGVELAMDVQRLEDGNTLVPLVMRDRLVEVDRRGKVVWEAKAEKMPWSVQRLGGGRTLVACCQSRQVAELDPGGEVVWSYPFQDPRHAQRLPDGNTVIANLRKVIEIDATKKVLWEYTQEKGIVHLSAY
jgi:hypothetical protein